MQDLLQNDIPRIFLLDRDFRLKSEYCDFSGRRSIVNKKLNTKFYVYRKDGSILTIDNYNPMEILNIVTHVKKKYIFYTDLHGRVAFAVMRANVKYDPMQFIDKLEKNPMMRTFTFLLFQALWFFGVLRSKDNKHIDEMHLSLGYKKTVNYKVTFLFPKKIRERFSEKTNKFSLFLHFYFVKVPLSEIYNYYLDSSDINIPVYVKTSSENGNYYYNFKGSTKDKYSKHHYIFNTRSLKLFKKDVEMYVRKSITGQYVVVVTSLLNKRVSFIETLAYYVSRLKRKSEVYDIYFEKFSQGASESGFELFKYAWERNKRSIYILDKSNPDYEDLKAQYPRNLFAKNSFYAFFYIFLARSFISSDLVSHVQRRLYDNDRLLKKKIISNTNKFFLQHGVSLATNLFERGYYNRKVPIAPDYIIMNSKYEQNLFSSSSGYTDKELLITGLPNLDLYVQSRSSIKNEITFLLTWRPWDLTGQVEEGGYIDRYLTFISMIKEDVFYKDKKINVILHPKAKLILQEQFEDVYNKHSSMFYEGDIKDALLKSKVLISDYSSVTYMAFAGGTNVIFYWEDKAKCEKEYGAKNILQEEIAFGDYVYNFKDLNSAIKQNYSRPQFIKHVEIYDRLVECADGKNTKNTYDEISSKLMAQ